VYFILIIEAKANYNEVENRKFINILFNTTTPNFTGAAVAVIVWWFDLQLPV